MSIHDKKPTKFALGSAGEDNVPMVTEGRRGWTSVGKDNGRSSYEYIDGAPMDGDQALFDVNYQAVNYGVLQIQKRIKTIGFAKNIVFDGKLGRRTSEAIKWVQGFLGLTVDGQCGPKTCRAMFRPYVQNKARAMDVPPKHLWGMCVWESGADPGAVGGVTPRDRGLFQINMDAHPQVSVADAFYLPASSTFAAANLATARALFSLKGEELQDVCGIAYHNSPKRAREWYAAGEPPTETIALYVQHVIESGELI